MAKKEKVYLKDTGLWGEIDHEGSAELFPETYARLDTLTHRSGKKLVWKCSEGCPAWASTVDNRTRGRGCPKCAVDSRVNSRNRPGYTFSLAGKFPEIAYEWDYDKNKPATPDETYPKSNKKYWWRCGQGHSWESRVSNRTSLRRGCPYCSKQRTSDLNRLYDIRPDIAEDWDYDKNLRVDLLDVSVSSGKKYWWTCQSGHESYKARVSGRTRGDGCPECWRARRGEARAAPKTGSSLGDKSPEIAGEWDYDRNAGLTPSDVYPSSSRRVWWLCPEGHSWESTVNNRDRGSGCPTCAKKYGRIEKRFIESFKGRTPLALVDHGKRLSQLKWSSGRSGVEVDMIFFFNHHYLLLEYDGSYWHRDKTELDTEKSRLLLSLGDNILHARIRENDLPDLDLVHDRFSQFRHDYHATESDSIERTVKEIERWFRERIGE